MSVADWAFGGGVWYNPQHMRELEQKWLMCVVALLLVAVPCRVSAKALVDFPTASGMNWRVWCGGFTDGENPQLSFSDCGMRVRLDSSKAKDGRRMAAPGPAKKPLVEKSMRLRLIVRNEGRDGVDASRISLGFVDAQGEKFEFYPADSIRSDESEWTLVYEILPHGWFNGFRGMTPRKGFTSGTNKNDVLDFPLRLDVLHVRLKEGASSGEVTFVRMSDETDTHPRADVAPEESVVADSVRRTPLPGRRPAFGERNASRAGAVKVDVDTGDTLHLLEYATPGGPRLVVRNSASASVSICGVARLRDFRGKGRDVPFRASLPSGGTNTIPLGVGFDKGMWRVICDWTAEDGSSAWDALRFAVMEFAKPTPRWPQGRHFRAGICWHPVFYSESDVALGIEALTKAGVKLARANGFAFALCEPQLGVFDWSRADRIQVLHEERGISLSAGFYLVPQWAVDGKAASGKLRNAEHRPSRPGLLRDYARALSARYGTKIDYYELGNEWDMVDERILSEDDALRLHREAWEGLKEGCADAKLISNGWASHMDFGGRHVRVGFQKRYMQRVKGMCDFHAFHLHGPFAGYARSVDLQLARRKELGVDIPWYSNETALTTVNGGERDAALVVWKKILYAWAHGSVDYIWYNLFAAGWMPCDEEQGYGLMTADAKPRAGYVALAGLIATLQGLDRQAILRKSSGDFVFSFRGETERFRGVALAGWSRACSVVRVKTDATAAFVVDLFGNRRPISVAKDGTVAWPVSDEPSALLLVDASMAETDGR